MSGRFLRRLRAWFWPGGPGRPRPPAVGLPPGLRVYAIGDIHGEAQLLDRLTRRIEADLASNRPEAVRCVFLGDYVDRGPDSSGVIERLASADFPLPFDTLRGNHEDMMLEALRTPDGMRQWCHTGGIETLRSYGVNPGKGRGGKTLGRWQAELSEALPPSHHAFLEATKTSLSVGGYFFVHAGARPGVPLDRQDEQDLMWIRHECYESSYDFGQVLVHGHTPHRRPENLDRRINVDTGAFKWGVLTAVVLEGDTRRFLSTGD